MFPAEHSIAATSPKRSRPQAGSERAALRWHARFVYETKNVDTREGVAVLALLNAVPANRLAAAALAELFSRQRSLERCAEALVRWSASRLARAISPAVPR